jgi:CDP-diacylglycerol--glycerol-3-phosphate 3-phosphatidyltransferase
MLWLLGAGFPGCAWLLLLFGAFTDWADGWMARRADGGSSWGARLDPLADKLLISAPLIWLAADQRLPLWAVWLLLARELLISGWRSGSSTGAPASWLGKWKTTFQFLSLFLMLWPQGWMDVQITRLLHDLGWVLFWPGLVLALWSAVVYLNLRSTPRRH